MWLRKGAARMRPPAAPSRVMYTGRSCWRDTIDSRLAEPMRASCQDLTEVVVPSGHWMAQERPVEVNASLAKWLATRFPGLWRV